MSRTTNLHNKPPLGTMISKRLKEMDRQQKWLAQEAQISKTYLRYHEWPRYPDVGGT